ncbi:MAG: hypothetical protein QGF00_10870 [Planctomycetota bacterium]|jgi:hypothetical protein|nr:hypothetical protein [Planctomycetota bacterium]MDP7250092.1 hypothetical protein [Planctomycetota bacterium]
MIPLDYGRSFLIGLAPKNEVRFWIESRTRIIDDQTGQFEDYIQTASCKSERTFAEKDLFQDDNYNFMPIFGPEYSVIFRRKAYLNDGYKDCVPSSQMWDGQRYHLIEPAECVELKSNEEIREATYSMHPIVGQTEISDSETGQRAIFEFPVKTMNTRRADDLYQVDTGPLAFPDLTKRHERNVDGISLAFVAFNAPDFADFVVEVPTSLGEGMPEVHHYSELISLPAQNRVYVMRDA